MYRCPKSDFISIPGWKKTNIVSGRNRRRRHRRITARRSCAFLAVRMDCVKNYIFGEIREAEIQSEREGEWEKLDTGGLKEDACKSNSHTGNIPERLRRE